MSTKKKEDRVKSGQSGSPHGRKNKEGASAGQGSDNKQIKINVWPEWSDNDVNNEKWETVAKGKEKDKTSKSPQQNLFEDPDGCLLMPPSTSVVVWKRCNEVFTKNPVVVDQEQGIHHFDIFSCNEHLFGSETMRWIICQINTLWMTSEHNWPKDSTDTPPVDQSHISPNGTYHSWRFWDHIFSINKVGKGLPLYNPSGKYVVKLFWMGEWRRIYVDDSLPFDENDRLLLPVTKLGNEIWPVILSKALLKVASLSYCKALGEMEFGDFSPINCLTGWIPQKKLITKEYQTQIWEELTGILPHYKYLDVPKLTDKEDTNHSPESIIPEASPDKMEAKESITKAKKDPKDKGKEKKEKEKSAKPHITVESNASEQEVLVMAAYKSHYSKLNYLTASKIADHSESLRKMGIAQFYSHPVLITKYRDGPLEKPLTPEPIPAWKLIRPMVRPEMPRADEITTHPLSSGQQMPQQHQPIQTFQIQTPFLNYNVNNDNFPRSYSNLAKSHVTGIEEDMIDDATEPPKTTLDTQTIEQHLTIKDTEMPPSSSKPTPNSNRKEKRSSSSVKQSGNESVPDEEMMPEASINNPVFDESKRLQKQEQMLRWISLEEFCDCFQTIIIYHRPETFQYSEKLTDKQTSFDQKEPFYLFTDNIEPTEIFVCVSSFHRWLTPPPEIVQPVIETTGQNIPSITPSTVAGLIKESSQINEQSNDDDIDNLYSSAQQSCIFIAEHFSWKSLRVGHCFKRMKTNATKAVSLNFPNGGRHCLRIFIQAPNGFHCRIVSKQAFSINNEDKIMQLCTAELSRAKELGGRIVGLYKSLLDNFMDFEKRSVFQQQLFDCILGINGDRQESVQLPKLTQIVSKALVKTIEKINPDLLTKDIIFPLRCLTLDFEPIRIISQNTKPATSSNRNSAKEKPAAAGKGENRKQSSTKAAANQDNKEEKKSDIEFREYSPEEMVKIIRLQKCIRGGYVRKVIRTNRALQTTPSTEESETPSVTLSPLFQRISVELAKISTVLSTNDSNNNPPNITLLSNIYELYPGLEKRHNLHNDRKNFISLLDFGDKISVPALGSGLTILFRDIFFLQSIPNKRDPLIIKLNAPTAHMFSLILIDNDSGEQYEDNILKRLVLDKLKFNENGYTLLGIVRGEPNSTNNQPINWRLKIICDGRAELPKFSKPNEINSEFSINKIKDYVIPEDNGMLFQQMMKVKTPHTISVLLRLSNPSARMLLTLSNNGTDVYSTQGTGEVFIPILNLNNDGAGYESQEESQRSASRLSSKSKKGKSAKNSRADSFCSDENPMNKYSVQVFIEKDKWDMSEEDKMFMEKQRKTRKTDLEISKGWVEISTKSGQAVDTTKKDAASKAPAKGKGKDKAQDSAKNVKAGDKSSSTKAGDVSSRPTSSSFEEVRPNWKLYVYSDSLLEDNIRIYKNNEKHEQLLKIKKTWKELDPTRFEKGKQAQLQYLEENGEEPSSETVTTEEKRPGSGINRKVKPLDLSEFYPPEDMIKEKPARMEDIEWFRQKKKEWDEWCIQEKLARKKRIIDSLEEYRELQNMVDMNRLKFYKAREVIRKQINSQSTSN